MSNLDIEILRALSFLRDSLTGRTAIAATLSDTADDPAGEGWIMTTSGGVVRALPAGNPEGSTIDITLAANEIVPIRFIRVYSTGTVATNIYIIK